MFGVEAVSPGRPGRNNFEVHNVCRDMGFTHMEGLVNMDQLVGKGRFRFIGFPAEDPRRHRQPDPGGRVARSVRGGMIDTSTARPGGLCPPDPPPRAEPLEPFTKVPCWRRVGAGAAAVAGWEERMRSAHPATAAAPARTPPPSHTEPPEGSRGLVPWRGSRGQRPLALLSEASLSPRPVAPAAS